MTNSFLNFYFLTTLIVLVIGLQASQVARNNVLFKRYIRDENGKLIDLNKEPSPERSIIKETGEGRQIAKNQQVGKTKFTLKSNPEAKSRYKILRPRRPIIIPEGLSKEEKRIFTNKVKAERKRESRKIMRSSTNDPYAKSLLENYKRAQAKQIVNRSELTKLVNNGKGTQEQISKVERRRARDRLYDQRLQASHKSNAVQIAQTMLLIKRQARDERGNLIDLNKEPEPEPVSSGGGTVEKHKSTSTDLTESKPSSTQDVKRKVKRIILPPGLSDQEKEAYRNKVKIERQRERRKLMRSSSEDNPYARFLLENHNKAKKKEVRKRTLRLRRVNDGKGTKAEVARIELKRKKDREYQLRRRIKQSTGSEKQTLTKKRRKLSNLSDQSKKDQ